MEDKVCNFFSWYVFHDLCVKRMNFDFENRTIFFDFEDFDDFIQKEVELKVIFKNVSKYTLNYPENEFYFDIRDVYSAHAEKKESGYELVFKFTLPEKKLGYELDVCEMCIGFEDLDVIGGLSPEAMEFKWREEG